MAQTMRGGQHRKAREVYAEQHSDERPKREGPQIWSTPKEGTLVIQLMPNPGVEPEDLENQAVNWREVYCSTFNHVDGAWSAGPFEGKPRADIPPGYRDIMVQDWEQGETSEGEPFFTITYSDPVEMPDGTVFDVASNTIAQTGETEGTNYLLDASTVDDTRWPGWLKHKDGSLKPNWRSLINVVVHSWPANGDRRVPEAGDHILLKMRDVDWADHIAPTLENAQALGANVYERLWSIDFTPKSGKVQRTVKTSVFGTDVWPEIVEESWDATEVYDSLRDNLIKLAGAAWTDQHNPSVATAEPVVEDAKPADMPFSRMSPQRLRAMLTKAGVEYEPKAPHKKLVELAEANAETPPF